MTDRVGSLPVVTAFGAVFCVALIFLALQMRAGDDPALGAGPKAATAQTAPRPVIVRRVIVRRVVEDSPGAPPAAAAATGPSPATSASAPTAAAPAPAPVTTQAS